MKNPIKTRSIEGTVNQFYDYEVSIFETAQQ